MAAPGKLQIHTLNYSISDRYILSKTKTSNIYGPPFQIINVEEPSSVQNNLLPRSYFILLKKGKWKKNLCLSQSGLNYKYSKSREVLMSLLNQMKTPCTLIVMPNFSYHNLVQPPVGFALGVYHTYKNEKPPLWLLSDKMYYGTTAIRIPNSLIKNINIGKIEYISSSNHSFRILNLDQDKMDAFLDKGNDNINEIKQQLSHDGSFAGIYTSRNIYNDNSDEVWIVVQTGDKGISQTFCEEIKTSRYSWELLCQKTVVGDINRKMENKRLNLVQFITKAFLNLDWSVINKDCEIIHNVTNLFESIYTQQFFVYYSSCVSMYTKITDSQGYKPLILNESPRTGIYILWNLADGMVKSGHDRYSTLSAFPYCTGREKSLPGWYKECVRPVGSKNDKSNVVKDDVIQNTFPSGNENPHPRLDPSVYRYRDSHFIDAERDLGVALCKETHLAPFFVILK